MNRIGFIGGSDMPVIMGLSSYKTPYQLYLEKTGTSECSEQSEQQYWGSTIESLLVAEFSKRNDVQVKSCATIHHKEHDFLRANLDGFIPELNAVLEVKCSSAFMKDKWGECGSDVIPMTYLVQVAFYCAVADVDTAFIAVLIGGNEYRQYQYTRDKDIESLILDAAIEFWGRIESLSPPEPTDESDLRIKYASPDHYKCVTVNESSAESLCDLIETKAQIKALQEQETNLKFNLMNYIGDAENLMGTDGDILATWKLNRKGSRTLLIKGDKNGK